MKGRQLGEVMFSHPSARGTVEKGRQYAAMVQLQLSLDAVL